MHLDPMWSCSVRDLATWGLVLAGAAFVQSIRTPERRQELRRALARCWRVVTDVRVLATALAAALVFLPTLVLADTGTVGCSGTALTNIQGLDNLIATIWGYLMSGPVTKVIAAALFVYGLFGLFERRAGPLVFGFSGAFIAAFAPTIIKAIFAGAGTGGAALC